MDSGLPKSRDVIETSANRGAVLTLTDMLPPQCRQDFTILRRFARETITHPPPADAVSPVAFREVLVTGATGFVGRYLLRDLLQQNPGLVVHCLVRADCTDEGEVRLQTVLQKAHVLEEIDWHRVRVIVGNINEHHFGLDEENYADLCRRIDAVYHFAAALSLAANYLQLRRINVFSIRNIIELSVTTRFKHVFFASTLGVFPEYFCSFGREFETSQIEDEAQPDIELMKRHFPLGLIGYPWSKLVSEQALLFANTLGMPLAIFRLPITGIATNGYVNPTDIVIRLSAAATQVEMTPPGFWARKHGDPVDTLADICVGISMNPERQHLIYHCCEPEPDQYDLNPLDMGMHLKEVSYSEFKRACLARGSKSPVDGHWALIDHFSKYWFYDRKSRKSSQINDLAIRTDNPNPIHWPNSLTKVVRLWDWITDHENNWPYSLPKFKLDYDLLVERAKSYAASMNVSFKDTYPDWMLQGLQHVVEALNFPEIKLRQSRRGLAVLQISRLLHENAELARERILHPEIENEQITTPVFILGINRTGTTFLHRLMSRDPRFWALRTYELFTTALPNVNYASVAGTADDSRRQFVQDYFEATNLQENFAGMHPFDVDEPEEDIKLLALAFASWTSNILRPSPRHNEWLDETGSKYAYPHHHRVLQHFNWQRRLIESTQSSKQWLLKMPFHLMELDNLIRTYPDALFIQTHRAPNEFMGSWMSMVENFRLQMFEPQSRYDLGIEQLELMSNMMNRAIDFRTRHPELDNRWIDINFNDFVQNPMNVVSDIYEKFDWPLNSSALNKMEIWKKQQDEHRKREVRHRYDLADYGLTSAKVDAAFENYLEFLKQLDL